MALILHKNDDGTTSLTTVVNEKKLDKALSMLGGVVVDLEQLDQDYLNAYKISSGQLSFDLQIAREIKIEQIRKQRDQAFIDFDKRFDIAFKDESNLSELRLERQNLKDAPQKAEQYLDSCVSLAEIKNLSIASLI